MVTTDTLKRIAKVRELAEDAFSFSGKDDVKLRIAAVYMKKMEVLDDRDDTAPMTTVVYADVDLSTDKFWGLTQLGVEPKPQTILVVGNDVEGTNFIGPFADEVTAIEHSESETFLYQDWHTATLHPAKNKDN